MYGRQVGLASLGARQKNDGIYVDSCYTGTVLIGTARWESIKARCTPRKAEHDITIRFGGGAAKAVSAWVVDMRIGDITTEVKVVVVRGHLPMLLGEQGMEKFAIDLRGAKRIVEQNGHTLGSWKVGEMPMVQLQLQKNENDQCMAGAEHAATDACSRPSMGIVGEKARQLKLANAGKRAQNLTDVNKVAIDDCCKKDGSQKIDDTHESTDGSRMDTAVDDTRVNTDDARVNTDDAQVNTDDTQANTDDAQVTTGWRTVPTKPRRTSARREPAREPACSPTSPSTGRFDVLMGEDDAGDADTEGEIAEDPADSRPKAKMQKYKAYQMPVKQLTKIHRTNHSTVSRMMTFLQSTVGAAERSAAENEKLKEKLLEVVESCRSCGVHEPSGDTHPPHVPDLNLKFNEKLWLDMANLDRHLRFEVLIMVDEAEAEVAMELVVEPTASKCWDAYYARWGSLRGHPGEMVSDGGGELAGPAFGDNADGAGILRTLTPAKSSPSHGRVERVIRTVRHSLDRLKEDERTAAWVESDYRRAVQTIENGIRNEVGLSSGGTMSTASVRSTGRCSSVHRNVLDMGAAEAEKSESVDKVVALAKKVYREAIASRTLREILHSKPHADDDAPELKIPAKSLVEVYRPETVGRSGGRRAPGWHGPARCVCWVSTSETSDAGYYHVDHRGELLRVHKGHCRLWKAQQGAQRTVQANPRDVDTTAGRSASGADHGKPGNDQHERNRSSADPEPQDPPGPARDGAPPVADSDSPGVVAHDDGAPPVDAVGTPHKADGEALPEPEPANDQPKLNRSPAEPAPERCKACRDKAAGRRRRVAHVGTCPHAQAGLAAAEEFLVHDSSDESGPDEELEYMGDGLFCPRWRTESSFLSIFDELERRLCPWQPTNVVTVGDELREDDADDAEYIPCLFAGSMDAYAYKWSDLSAEEQARAWDRAFEDYDSTGSWERGTEQTKEALQRRGIKPMRGRAVEKAKFADGELIGRVRWTPKGFMQRLWKDGAWQMLEKSATESPTVHRITSRTLDVVCKMRGLKLFVLDFSEAFFHSELLASVEAESEDQLWVEVPAGDVKFKRTNENAAAHELYKTGGLVYRKLLREVPGTKSAPRSWYESILNYLLDQCGATQSKADPCVVYFTDTHLEHNGEFDTDLRSPYCGYAALHVDDMKGRATPEMIEYLSKTLKEKYKVTVKVVETGEVCEYVGERYHEYEDYTEVDQEQYCKTKLAECSLEQGRWKLKSAAATDDELSNYRTTLGQAMWVTSHGRGELQYETSYGASAVNSLRIGDITRLNKSVRLLKDPRFSYRVKLPKLSMQSETLIRAVVDAGEGEQGSDVWEKAYGGRLLGLHQPDTGLFATLEVRAGKLGRVTHSSFDGESVNAIEAVDVALAVQYLIAEYENGVQVSRDKRLEMLIHGETDPDANRRVLPIQLDTDSKSLVDRVESAKLDSQMSKRRKADVADLQELRWLNLLKRLRHVAGKSIPADCLTKPKVITKETMHRLVTILKTGLYEPVSA